MLQRLLSPLLLLSHRPHSFEPGIKVNLIKFILNHLSNPVQYLGNGWITLPSRNKHTVARFIIATQIPGLDPTTAIVSVKEQMVPPGRFLQLTVMPNFRYSTLVYEKWLATNCNPLTMELTVVAIHELATANCHAQPALFRSFCYQLARLTFFRNAP